MARQTAEEADLLTPGEVAVKFRVDTKTIGRWARDGLLDEALITLPSGVRRYKKAVILTIVAGQSDNGPTG